MSGIVGVKYCGGCNPRYDRVAMALRLRQAFPCFHFRAAEPGAAYDALLVLCGCGVCCADLTGLKGSARCTLCREEDYAQAVTQLIGVRDKWIGRHT